MSGRLTSAEQALIDAAATARLTRLVVEDRVPFGPIRDRLEKRGGYLGELVSCPWCSSAYCAIFVVFMRRRYPRVWQPVATALAMSYAAGFLAGHETN